MIPSAATTELEIVSSYLESLSLGKLFMTIFSQYRNSIYRAVFHNAFSACPTYRCFSIAMPCRRLLISFTPYLPRLFHSLIQRIIQQRRICLRSCTKASLFPWQYVKYISNAIRLEVRYHDFGGRSHHHRMHKPSPCLCNFLHAIPNQRPRYILVRGDNFFVEILLRASVIAYKKISSSNIDGLVIVYSLRGHLVFDFIIDCKYGPFLKNVTGRRNSLRSLHKNFHTLF